MEIFSESTNDTKEAGRRLSTHLKGGETLALVGEMGAGKTHFIQGLAEGLGITSRITSPTFIIMREYETDNLNFYHVDLYRLEENIERELENLGITDLWGKSKNIFAIEWADRAKDYLPENTIWVKFTEIDNENRKIEIEGI